LGGIAVFLYFLYKGWTDRARTPAAPYVGTPYIAITLMIMLIAIVGDSISLNMYTGYFALIFGFVIKVGMTLFVWPFWLAGLIMIPFVHIGSKLTEAFKKTY
jgi:hypothetical protein